MALCDYTCYECKKYKDDIKKLKAKLKTNSQEIKDYIEWSINQMRQAAKTLEAMKAEAIKSNNFYSIDLKECAGVGETLLNKIGAKK